MPTLETRLLWHFQLSFGPPQAVGMTPHGMRMIWPITGGSFEGPRLRGEILPGGADAVLIRPDGVTELDIRVVGRISDGALLYATPLGLHIAAPEINQRILRGEKVADADTYTRTAYRFETSSKEHAWLNRILAIGVYRLTGTGVEGDVYEVL